MNLTKHKNLAAFIALLIADMAVFCTTDTRSVPSYMLIVGYLLLTASVYFLLSGFVMLLRLYGVHFKHNGRMVITGTILVSGMIALQSIGQLAPRDVIGISVVASLLYLYVSYAKVTKQNIRSIS